MIVYSKFRLFEFNLSSCRIYTKGVVLWLSTTKQSLESFQLRINKAIPSLSRRSADDAIKNKRVTVNGKYPHLSLQVTPADIILLDGVVQHPKFRCPTAASIDGKNDNSSVLMDNKSLIHNGLENKIISHTSTICNLLYVINMLRKYIYTV